MMRNKDFQQLNIVNVEHDKVWSLCPHHKDIVRPNLSISLLDKYYGRWNCWACGRNGCLSKEQMNKLNLSGSTIHKNNKDKLQTRWKQFNESCYDNLQKFPLLKLGLAKQLDISIKSLNDWLVGYDGNAFTIPMFREDLLEYKREGGFCGIQRRFPDGSKRCVTGSHLGLMYPCNYIGDYYIFICEGFSDAISIWDLGLQSMARPHCRYTDGIEEFFGDGKWGTEHIVIVPDNDTVGKEGATKLQGVLDGMNYYDDEGWEINCDISIFPLDGAKDVRQLIQLRGKDYVRQELEKWYMR